MKSLCSDIPADYLQVDCDGKPVRKVVSPPKPDQWIIPDSQTQERMRKYEMKIRRNHPDWSIQRATRKMAEKFKLKKV